MYSIRDENGRIPPNVKFQGHQLPSCTRGLRAHMVEVKYKDALTTPSTTTPRPKPQSVESKFTFQDLESSLFHLRL